MLRSVVEASVFLGMSRWYPTHSGRTLGPRWDLQRMLAIVAPGVAPLKSGRASECSEAASPAHRRASCRGPANLRSCAVRRAPMHSFGTGLKSCFCFCFVLFAGRGLGSKRLLRLQALPRLGERPCGVLGQSLRATHRTWPITATPVRFESVRRLAALRLLPARRPTAGLAGSPPRPR